MSAKTPMSCSHAASIVVLEDDALMRNLLVEWLSAEGYSVRTCTKHTATR